MNQNPDEVIGIPPDLIIGPSSDVLPMSNANWGVKTFHLDLLRQKYSGQGVIVGICDTGIYQHNLLASKIVGARDFTNSPYGSNDANGHGTHCSGTVGASDPNIGMAPNLKGIVHGKCLSDQGSGLGTWIRDAMQYSVDQGATILSLSLGSSSQDTTITNKMEQLADQGIWIIAAAGNSGPNTPDIDWPGRSPHCISVAALDTNLSPASFSSAGAKIDTSYAGVNIWSTKAGGGYQQMSGTSMATPGVAGILACYRSGLIENKLPIPKINDLRKLLLIDSTDTFNTGVDRRTGPGWISPILLALNLVPDPKGQ